MGVRVPPFAPSLASLVLVAQGRPRASRALPLRGSPFERRVPPTSPLTPFARSGCSREPRASRALPLRGSPFERRVHSLPPHSLRSFWLLKGSLGLLGLCRCAARPSSGESTPSPLTRFARSGCSRGASGFSGFAAARLALRAASPLPPPSLASLVLALKGGLGLLRLQRGYAAPRLSSGKSPLLTAIASLDRTAPSLASLVLELKGGHIERQNGRSRHPPTTAARGRSGAARRRPARRPACPA